MNEYISIHKCQGSSILLPPRIVTTTSMCTERRQIAYIKRIRPDVLLPRQGTPGSTGYDVHAIFSFVLPAHKTARIPLGFAVTPPPGSYVRTAPRSSLVYNCNITIDGGSGVVDPDYTGELHLLLNNGGDIDISIAKGDRIGQIVFEKFEHVVFVETHTLMSTTRSSGGYGSTGK